MCFGCDRQVWRAAISYSDTTHGYELSQVLNVIFGNTSIKEGIEVVDVAPSPAMLRHFKGPRFGVAGLRQLLAVPAGPLLMTALKPMGTPTSVLADMAYQFALGGIDIIKDDHGLSNQPASPYEERVTACCAAVARANAETGRKCLYAPCVNAPAHLVLERARFAKRAGAGAILVIPGITGFDSMRLLADDPDLGLPIVAHPAMLGGSLASSRVHGFSHRVLLGTLMRLAGADASIFPNYGGRFGFTQAECVSVGIGCAEPLGTYPPIFPTPGGGMSLDRTPEMAKVYGGDVCLLIGGSLYARSKDLAAAARDFLKAAGRS